MLAILGLVLLIFAIGACFIAIQIAGDSLKAFVALLTQSVVFLTLGVLLLRKANSMGFNWLRARTICAPLTPDQITQRRAIRKEGLAMMLVGIAWSIGSFFLFVNRFDSVLERVVKGLTGEVIGGILSIVISMLAIIVYLGGPFSAIIGLYELLSGKRPKKKD